MVYSEEKYGYIVILTTNTLYLLKASEFWQALLITTIHSYPFSFAVRMFSHYRHWKYYPLTFLASCS